MSKNAMDRREFLKRTGVAAAGVSAATALGDTQAAGPSSPLKKAVQLGMLPKEMSDAEKLALARSCGFEGIEAYPMEDLAAAKRLGDAARTVGVPIHSICYGGWRAPFSAPDSAVIEEGLDGMENALRTAHALGADAVLLVPAVVNEKVRYIEAWERSQEHIPKLFPLAEELGVVIAVENVWNNFLLSPLEFARYVDAFESPWLRAYFDVGNVVAFGWPQDWIRTLGQRICKIHLKDFKREGRQWVNLREGDVNWIEVRRALDEVGYTGYMTTELPGGDEAYLKDLSERIDAIIAGA